MNKRLIEIEGMSCGHCVMAVKKQLTALTGVTVENILVGKAELTIDEGIVTDQLLRTAVERSGYTVRSIR